MLQAECKGKAKHKLVVEATQWKILVIATAERLDMLVIRATRSYAVVMRTPCSLGKFLTRNFHTKATRR